MGMRRFSLSLAAMTAALTLVAPVAGRSTGGQIGTACVIVLEKNLGPSKYQYCSTAEAPQRVFHYRVIGAPRWYAIVCGESGCKTKSHSTAPATGIVKSPSPCPCRAFLQVSGPVGSIGIINNGKEG